MGRFACGTALALLVSMPACLRAPYDVEHEGARMLRVPAAPPGETSAESTYRAIPFPPRVTTHPVHPPLVVLEPVLFRRELLLEPGGLVASLEDAGFTVWLVGPEPHGESSAALDEASMALGIEQAIVAVAQATGAGCNGKAVDVLALGLSGAPAIEALAAVQRRGPTRIVGKVAFYGTPLDGAYPNSFDDRTASVPSGPASALCALDLGHACRELFRDARAVTWLGELPARPDAAVSATAVRYPGLALLSGVDALFVAGKGDGVAPTESLFPVFRAWGGPKRFFVVGIENGFASNADAFGLLQHDVAAGAWDEVVSFLGE